jgi:hypothetical protein
MKAKYRHFGCRITDDSTYKGMNVLFMENELIKIGILLDKGADLFQFIYKPKDIDFLWKSPLGIQNPHRFKESIASDSGSFLDNYHGGWQEIFPGGGPYVYQGAEIGLHGEVTQLGWDYTILEDEPENVKIKLTVDCVRTPFRIEKTIHLKSQNPSVYIEEKITNLSSQDLNIMWGQHPSFGAPFLEKGNRLFLDAKRAMVHKPQFMSSGIFKPGVEFDWPILKTGGKAVDLSVIGGSSDGYGDMIYIRELVKGWYACINPESQVGFGLAWPKEIYPYIWYWLVYGMSPGYPWWNRTYCVALEPWTSYPNSFDDAVENGTIRKILGNETITIPITAVAISGLETVSEIDISGSVKR